MPPSRSARRHVDPVAGRFARSRAGTSAIEFALILPIMLVLWAGMAEVSHAIGAWRKVTLLSRTVADLSSQGDSYDPMAPATMTDILAASAAVLRPLAGSSAQIVVSAMGVYTTNLINPQVCSSAASTNATARKTGVATDLKIPAAYAATGTRYIFAEVSMTYAPMIGSSVVKLLGWTGGTIPLRTSFAWPVRNGYVHNSTSSPAATEITMPNGTPCP
jgi:Flp pilus assembly protein TadG